MSQQFGSSSSYYSSTASQQKSSERVRMANLLIKNDKEKEPLFVAQDLSSKGFKRSSTKEEVYRFVTEGAIPSVGETVIIREIYERDYPEDDEIITHPFTVTKVIHSAGLLGGPYESYKSNINLGNGTVRGSIQTEVFVTPCPSLTG